MADFINSHKISISVMFMLAVFAAACTLFFAVAGGIANTAVIVTRVMISFGLFLILGFLLGLFLQNMITDILDKTGWTGGKKTIADEDAVQTGEPAAGQSPDEQQFSPVPGGVADDSFERVVIVNRDEDNQ